MAKLLFIALLLAQLVFSTGCTYWYQESRSYENCRSDLAQCVDEMEKYADPKGTDSIRLRTETRMMEGRELSVFEMTEAEVSVSPSPPS